MKTMINNDKRNENLEKAKTSKTFCIYPWIHQYVGPTGDVKPCCAFAWDREIGNLKQNTLKEIWNNEETKQMRLDMLDGKLIKGCEKCDEREGVIETARYKMNMHYFVDDPENVELVAGTNEDGSLDTHELQFIDSRFNNLCNLKCRTCGPDYSSSWHKDYQALYGYSDGEAFRFAGKTQNQLLDETMPHLKHVKTIYFAGGEPLMQIEHYKMLEELIRLGRTDIRIEYNTNFTNLKLGKYYAPDLWRHFSNLNIYASLDGSHEKGEYWRKGTKWDMVVENRKQTLEVCPNINFLPSYTVSWVNIYNLVEFHREWYDLGLLDKRYHLSTNILHQPEHYNVKYIPTWKKDKIHAMLREHIEWLDSVDLSQTIHKHSDWYENVIKYMYDHDSGDKFEYQEDFVNATYKLDEIRGENFWEVYPEHEDMRKFLGL